MSSLKFFWFTSAFGETKLRSQKGIARMQRLIAIREQLHLAQSALEEASTLACAACLLGAKRPGIALVQSPITPDGVESSEPSAERF